MLRKPQPRVRLDVGSVMPFRKLEGFSGDADMTEFLRRRTFVLCNRWDSPAGAIPTARALRGRIEDVIDPLSEGRDDRGNRRASGHPHAG